MPPTAASLTRSSRDTARSIRGGAAMHAGARAGFVAAGVVHILLGVVALGVAFGGGGSADQSGALAALRSEPGGPVLLWVVVLALWALSLFLLLSAALVRGTGKSAWYHRGKYASTGIAYLAVGLTGVGVARSGSSSSAGKTRAWSARLLDAPGGKALLVVVALVVLGVAVYFVMKGATHGYRKDISVPAGLAGRAVEALATVGYVAKGVALAVVAVLTGVAALTSDPQKSAGLDGALKSLAGLPFGVVLLVVVAAGLVAYGCYFFARARYARL
ncbi:DUF1206 domain-containing protein [Luteimicrobium sp. DT211]|uniref:DUF1206 domain-containing protein n=1 Tax=Luteimicrobium sp. DT211 TaxID=3393412 RepID=UPI003CE9AB83